MQRLDFQKYFSSIRKNSRKEPDFEFVPYKFGYFSFQSYADRRRLVEVAALSDTEEWQLQKAPEIEKGLFDKPQFDVFYERYSPLRGNDLVQHIYSITSITLSIANLLWI